jgi:hypothetical protein
VRWATLTDLAVPIPPSNPARWHNWGIPGSSKRPWLQVTISRDLAMQVGYCVQLPSFHHGFTNVSLFSQV